MITKDTPLYLQEFVSLYHLSAENSTTAAFAAEEEADERTIKIMDFLPQILY
jgi:hypothetical protein